jgi:hypothetical protein
MSVSEVCVVYEVLCSVSDGHYTEFGNCSIPDEEKGKRGLGTTRLAKERHANEMSSHILLKGDARCEVACPLYLICKKILTDYSPRDFPCANTEHDRWHTDAHVCVPMATCLPDARSTAWSISCLTSFKHLDCCGFKSW